MNLDGDTSDSMEYPSGDETSEYERRILKVKRRRERAFYAQFKAGECTKASQLGPKPSKESDEEDFKPVQTTPRRKTYKRRSMPAIAIQPRKSLRLDGKPVNYSGLDDNFVEPPVYRRKSGVGKPGRRSMPRIALAREVDFNPDGLPGEICYSSNKVYSQNGTTCHQCRQKTIDLKSRCYDPFCRGVRGMFCGYCLRQRYGEDVAEVLRNPEWKCPPCRNICNCSICRRRYGKAPTGQLFQYASSRGFANVKDYLAEKNDLVLVEDDEDLEDEPLYEETDEAVGNSKNDDDGKSPRRKKARQETSKKENLVPEIKIKEEPEDFSYDTSLYQKVDYEPKVFLEKIDIANV